MIKHLILQEWQEGSSSWIIVLQSAVSAKQEKPFQRRGEGNLLQVLRERGTSAAKKKGLPFFPISFDLKLLLYFSSLRIRLVTKLPANNPRTL